MNQKSILYKIVGVAVLMAGGMSVASAADDVSVSAGVRLWSNQWQANNFPVINGTTVSTHFDSGTKLVAIPVASVRYKEFGVSASHFMETSYSLSDGRDTGSSKRSETDLNFSYSLLPGLSASVGYKEIKWTGVTINGPTIALSGSAPIGSGFGLYGTGGIGWLNTKVSGIGNSTNTNYALGEFGLSYSIDTKSTSIKGLTATLGYRFQKITANGASFANNRDVSDTTSGLTVGLIGSF